MSLTFCKVPFTSPRFTIQRTDNKLYFNIVLFTNVKYCLLFIYYYLKNHYVKIIKC